MNWKNVATKLQMKEITQEEMPRLFFECLQDRERWETKAENFAGGIKHLNSKIQKEIREEMPT